MSGMLCCKVLYCNSDAKEKIVEVGAYHCIIEDEEHKVPMHFGIVVVITDAVARIYHCKYKCSNKHKKTVRVDMTL